MVYIYSWGIFSVVSLLSSGGLNSVVSCEFCALCVCHFMGAGKELFDAKSLLVWLPGMELRR